MEPLTDFLKEKAEYNEEQVKSVLLKLRDAEITSLFILSLFSEEELIQRTSLVTGKLLARFLKMSSETPTTPIKQTKCMQEDDCKGSQIDKLPPNRLSTKDEAIEYYSRRLQKWNSQLGQYGVRVSFTNNYQKYYCPIRDSTFELPLGAKISNAKATYAKLTKKKSSIRKQLDVLDNRLLSYFKDTARKEKPSDVIVDKELIDNLKAWEEQNPTKSAVSKQKRKYLESDESEDDVDSIRNSRMNFRYVMIRNSLMEKSKEDDFGVLQNLTDLLSTNTTDMSTEQKIKIDFIYNLFKKKPRYENETLQFFSATRNQHNPMRILRNYLPIPSTNTLKEHKPQYLESFENDLTFNAMEYFTKGSIGCFTIDATAINQEVSLNTESGQVFGFEENIQLNTEEDWLQFLENYREKKYHYASNMVTIHLIVCDNLKTRSMFVLRCIPISNYSKQHISNWISTLQNKLSSHLQTCFISADSASEHMSFFTDQFLKLKGSPNCNFVPLPILKINSQLVSNSNTLIPIPDIRHLLRNLCNQIVSPKKLFAIGSYYTCCFQVFRNFDSLQVNLPNDFFNLNDKQNQERADFLISDSCFNLLSEDKFHSGFKLLLQAVRKISDSIRIEELDHFSRLRKLCEGGFFILMQTHYAIYQSNYGNDHTFSKQTITSLTYLIFGLVLSYHKYNCSGIMGSFFPFQLQEYKTENFYGFSRGRFGGKRNLKAEDFICAANDHTGCLLNGMDFTGKKNKDTKLRTELFDIMPSDEHIQYIISTEFYNAKMSFLDNVFDATEESFVSLYTLLNDLNVNGIANLLQDEPFGLFTQDQISEFERIEETCFWRKELFPVKTKSIMHHPSSIQLGDKIFNKKSLIRRITFPDRRSRDVARSRRFDKQKQTTISNESSQLSSQLLNEISQINTEEDQQQIFKVGDYILQKVVVEDENEETGEKTLDEIVFVCLIRQIKHIVSKSEKKKIKDRPSWNGKDYKYSIKWEYVTETTLSDALSDYRFLLQNFRVTSERFLSDTSFMEINTYYEEISNHTIKVNVRDRFLYNTSEEVEEIINADN